MYRDAPPESFNCSELGILSPIAGTIGSWQATEIIKEILGVGQSLAGSMIIFNGLDSTSRKVKLAKDSECKTCGNHITTMKVS